MHLKYSQGQAFYKLYTALLDIPSWTINLLKYTYIFILYFNRIDTVIFATLMMKIRLSYEGTQLLFTIENILAMKKSYTMYSMFLIYSSIKQEFIKLEYNCIITNNITQSAHNKH